MCPQRRVTASAGAGWISAADFDLSTIIGVAAAPRVAGRPPRRDPDRPALPGRRQR
ncbi:hypothetical protein [Frankia sp. AgKG'84/4]|uniref:hypothetical protein n=1 Tax=Frankia sp. AgKG'84/4 TaxID=573490 RepID=UPI00200D2EAD|nr:hypothetical protein [Frankia sp. AgKG'84/4]MCL9795515.1 hypothetical protein [Frankia sp. AgKG'84/4]